MNLNDPDKQCHVNRSGLLCDKCKEGLSLVLVKQGRFGISDLYLYNSGILGGNSVTVAKLLASSLVPVLATLFLLPYAKVLHTIVAAFILTVLHYPCTQECIGLDP